MTPKRVTTRFIHIERNHKSHSTIVILDDFALAVLFLISLTWWF